MQGRKPKPAGMSTRRPTRSDGPAVRLPACPAHLQGEARREWKRLGKKLVECGLMTEIDGAALALYCEAWSRWVDAERALEKFGVMVKSPNGFPMQSPYLAVANKAMEQIKAMLTEFGMSPSSRSRVSAAPAAPAPRAIRTQDEEDPRLVLFRQQSNGRSS